MKLTTKRLILRPWLESDAESLYEYAKDPGVGPIAGWPPHTSVENSREIIREVLSAQETYAVCRKEDNRAVGSIGLMFGSGSELDLPEGEAEIGYWIGLPFWGQGLIPEAVRELLCHGFIDLKLEKIWCGYFDGNEKSRRVQEKCGFTYHHTNSNIYWRLMDEIRTEHITCLTREEWSKVSVRKLTEAELPEALSLAWEVFQEYEAPDYSEEGVKEFARSIHDESFLAQLCVFGAFRLGELAGVIATSSEGTHIALFFVQGRYHRQGIGKQLFQAVLDSSSGRLTVNSSPYAVPVYHRLGFCDTAEE